MEMKLHRMLLASCKRMHQPFNRHFHSMRLLNSSSPFSSNMGGSRTLLCGACAVRCPMKYAVPLGTRDLGLNSRRYSNVGSDTHCRQESRCELRRTPSSAGWKRNLLQGGATWPGKNERPFNAATQGVLLNMLLYLKKNTDTFQLVFVS